ncbi:integrin alpha, partial [bacterium]|nr:integrin alpha [bacterium]
MPARFRVRIHGLTPALVAITSTALVLVASLAAAATTELLLGPTGEAVGDALGPVAHAGDVNGDGFDDVIAGAPENDAGGADAGRAYVYYGGPAADDVADLVLTGEAAGDGFGTGVAGAGDVNGDGFADVVVGAPFQAAGGVNAGRAYVYYGGPFEDTVADLTLTGEAVGDNFGESVAGAGDVNGDGYDDVIAGARYHNEIDPDRGRAYVYFGGPAADAVADLTVTGATTGDQLGCSVAGAGDLNVDGFDDIIAGARLASSVGDERGYAYVYYGGANPDALYDLRLSGENAGDFFGSSVAGVGDVNADGFDDVLVGAPENDTAGAAAGAAYVFHGGPPMDDVADLVLTGEASFDFLGSEVSGAGDVNGDGFDDVIAGATGSDAVGTSSGRAFVYFGGASADAVADLVFTGDSSFDFLGTSVGGGGDVNGDGFADLLIGATGESLGGSSAGRAYVYSSFPYRVTSPNGGERWVAGEAATVRWKGVDPADLELSVDGGFSYSLLAGGVGGDPDNELTVIAPASPTGAARVRLTYQGASATRSTSDASDQVFRIAGPAGAVACRLHLPFTGEVPGDR